MVQAFNSFPTYPNSFAVALVDAKGDVIAAINFSTEAAGHLKKT